MSEERMEMIRHRIEKALAPVSIEIQDDGHLHRGHKSANGGGHFTVSVVADGFAGKSLLQRHRMVYSALGDAMEGEVHALSIQARTPQEASG